ncbi:MAG TPA: hypothetical protein VGO93_04070 [Candidatus Xenobia bacterium]|jgi:hypothetical protein
MPEVAERPTRSKTTLESSLSTTEAHATTALASTARLATAVKQSQAAALTGDLKALHKALESAAELLQQASQDLDALRASWRMTEEEEEAYLASGQFQRELLAAAGEAGLNLFPQDTLLACYPSLVKVQPKERNVLIDRKSYRGLRPTHLVAHLARLQKKSPKTNAAQFLETLLAAWQMLNQKRGGAEKLLDIYKAITLLPSSRQDYSQQEFARDVYLLDASGLTATRQGVAYRLHPGATGAKDRSNLLVVVTREGLERNYYSIEFMI